MMCLGIDAACVCGRRVRLRRDFLNQGSQNHCKTVKLSCALFAWVLRTYSNDTNGVTRNSANHFRNGATHAHRVSRNRHCVYLTASRLPVSNHLISIPDSRRWRRPAWCPLPTTRLLKCQPDTGHWPPPTETRRSNVSVSQSSPSNACDKSTLLTQAAATADHHRRISGSSISTFFRPIRALNRELGILGTTAFRLAKIVDSSTDALGNQSHARAVRYLHHMRTISGTWASCTIRKQRLKELTEFPLTLLKLS